MQVEEGWVSAGQGVRLFYERLGAVGEPVVVANGYFMRNALRGLAAADRTLLFVDGRRGRSDLGTDPGVFDGGIARDIDDFETLRKHFGWSNVAVIGHSYCGAVAAAYALQHPHAVSRVVQIGPSPPVWGTQYPAELSWHDAVYEQVMRDLAALGPPRGGPPSEAECRKLTAALLPLYVTHAADVSKVGWDPCLLANERGFMGPWMEHIVPSLARLDLGAAATLRTPVLTIAGRKDRSTPYGGSRAWTKLLPNARLVTVPDGGHLPWIEAPGLVIGAIDEFLRGAWPAEAIRPE
jgi:pimeloyl-ACP methyl ester carboxylesterase